MCAGLPPAAAAATTGTASAVSALLQWRRAAGQSPEGAPAASRRCILRRWHASAAAQGKWGPQRCLAALATRAGCGAACERPLTLCQRWQGALLLVCVVHRCNQHACTAAKGELGFQCSFTALATRTGCWAACKWPLALRQLWQGAPYSRSFSRTGHRPLAAASLPSGPRGRLSSHLPETLDLAHETVPQPSGEHPC